MSDVFLSYATEDRGRLRPIVEALESRGWTVWWDRTIAPGLSFDREIERALNEAKCVVVLWSASSVESDWVKIEAAEAARRRVLVPAMIDEVTIPLEFRRIQAARLVGWSGDEANEELDRLLGAVGRMLGQASPPVTLPASEPPPRSVPGERTRRRWPWVLTGIVGFLLAMTGGWLVTSGPDHEPTVIGVMQISPGKGVDPDACNFTRDGLNTVMSSLPRVQVYSKQKIDFLREKRGLTDPEVAEELGIGTILSGTLTMRGDAMVLSLDAVDGVSGMLRASRSVSGSEAELAEMQAQAIFRILEALGVPVSAKEKESLIASRSNDGIERYNLTTQMMGGFVEDEPPSPGSRNEPGGTWWPDVPASAFADDRGDVVSVLEQYRKALEEKDMAGVSATYVSISDGMRTALTRFFSDATDVKVTFSDYDVEVGGDEALATFTRVDDFLDQKTGQRVRFEIRVSSILAKQADGWRIRGLKKPS